MGKVRIKIKRFEGKDNKEFAGLHEEEWINTEFYCIFCGHQTVVLRAKADDKCACLACDYTYYIKEPKTGKDLSYKDAQRLDILKHRYQELKEG
jgi:transcription elongation factor Elf1